MTLKWYNYFCNKEFSLKAKNAIALYFLLLYSLLSIKDFFFSKCAQWLLTEGEKYLATLKPCLSTEELSATLQKLHRGHFDVAAVKYMISKLDRWYVSFQQKLEQSKNLMEQTLAFYQSVESVSCFDIVLL